MIGYLIGLIAVVALVLSIICMTRCKTDKFGSGQQHCYYQIWDKKQKKYVDDPTKCTRSSYCDLNIAYDSWENGTPCMQLPRGCENCCNKPLDSGDGYLNATCGRITPR